MVFGISTKVLRDFSLEEAITIVETCGYEAIELWMDDLLTSGLPAEKIVQMTDRSGLQRTVHLLTEDLNIASFNAGIRRESLKQQKEGIRRAADIGARSVTLHPGRKSAKARNLEEAWKCQIDSINELAIAAEECGVTLCVEAMEKIAGEFVLTPYDLSRVINGCASSNLAVTLDISHLQTVGDVNQLLREAEGIPVGNIHISQSYCGKPHLPLYAQEGEIDYLEVFHILGSYYDKTVILEGYIPNAGLEIAEHGVQWYKNTIKALEVV